MSYYIQQLRKISEENLSQSKLKYSKHLPHWESLEAQIQRWWMSLPPVLQYRRFQIAEIAAQCHGRYKRNPALREVAVTLRALGWIEIRDWSNQGRNKRLWRPQFKIADQPKSNLAKLSTCCFS